MHNLNSANSVTAADNSKRKRPLLVFLMGPTAAGKTGLAVELVRRLPFEIISVDSALVYRGMDIGTAKPGRETLAQAPHHLLDIREPVEPYSAAEFRSDALAHIEDILSRDRVPLLTGGTMLYFHALAAGLSRLPSADPAVRSEIEAEAQQSGWQFLHARLAEVDPESAARIHINDPQRIQRALEVFHLTGRPLSVLLEEQHREPFPYQIVRLIVAPADRSALHRRIEQRFHDMLEQGFVDEVRSLRDLAGMHKRLPSMRAVGYRQLWAYLDGMTDYDTAVSKGITATRQFAKRQLTWLRAEKMAKWFEGSDQNMLDKVLKSLKDAQIY